MGGRYRHLGVSRVTAAPNAAGAGQHVAMRRSGATLALLLAVSVLPGVGGCGRSCTAYEYSIASGATGAATSTAALSSWLSEAPPPGFNTDPASWAASTNDPAIYSDGNGRITVEKAGAQGYFVTSAHTCNV